MRGGESIEDNREGAPTAPHPRARTGTTASEQIPPPPPGELGGGEAIELKGVVGRRHDPDTTPRRRCRGHRQARGAKTPSGTKLLSDLSQILRIENSPWERTGRATRTGRISSALGFSPGPDEGNGFSLGDRCSRGSAYH